MARWSPHAGKLSCLFLSMASCYIAEAFIATFGDTGDAEAAVLSTANLALFLFRIILLVGGIFFLTEFASGSYRVVKKRSIRLASALGIVLLTLSVAVIALMRMDPSKRGTGMPNDTLPLNRFLGVISCTVHIVLFVVHAVMLKRIATEDTREGRFDLDDPLMDSAINMDWLSNKVPAAIRRSSLNGPGGDAYHSLTSTDMLITHSDGKSERRRSSMATRKSRSQSQARDVDDRTADLHSALVRRFADDRDKSRWKWQPCVLIFVFLAPIFIGLACMLPPIFNMPLHTYLPLKSQHSLMYLPLGDYNRTGHERCWTSVNATLSSNNETCEMVPSRHWLDCLALADNQDPEEYCEYNAKIYFDVVVLWFLMYSLLLVKVVSVCSLKCYEKIRSQMLIRDNDTNRNCCYTTQGETYILILMTSCMVAWVLYWALQHEFVMETNSPWEKIGRVSGHITNLYLAFLAFPITKVYGVLQLVFTLSEGKTIRYHRWAASMCISSLIVHTISWIVLWAKKGTLSDNLFAYKHSTLGNWTVVAGQLAFVLILLLAMMSIEKVRKKKFEWFVYAHGLSVFIFILALVHAPSLWYYLSFPLLFYLVDRAARVLSSTGQWTVVSVETRAEEWEDYFRIVLQKKTVFGRAVIPYGQLPGQYVHLCVPGISWGQWHKMAICSAPSDDVLAFYVRDMGPGTWTSQLAMYAHNVEASREDEDPEESVGSEYELLNRGIMQTINVDGAFGGLPPFNHYKVLVLVCGGIGFAPMHALLRHLMQRQIANMHVTNTLSLPGTNIDQVHFIWCVRKKGMLSMCEATLDILLNPSSKLKHKFKVKLYASQERHTSAVDEWTGAGQQLPFKAGRPNIEGLLRSVFQEAATDVESDHKKNPLTSQALLLSRTMKSTEVGVFCCAPPSMTTDTRTVSAELGFQFHQQSYVT